MGIEVGGVRFQLAELIDEVKAIQDLGRHFLTGSGLGALAAFGAELDRIRWQSTDAPTDVALLELRTKPTRDYERGSRTGRREIYASMKGIWTLRPLGQPQRNIVEFSDKASLRVTLWESSPQSNEDRQERLAMWRIEVASPNSPPGCYFHIQVLGDCTRPPFPQDISIPRLPSLFVTPMAAVEFVLCELFQDKWAEAASRSQHHRNRWRSIQETRLRQLLEWQRNEALSSEHSPWMKLKEATPDPDLFLP